MPSPVIAVVGRPNVGKSTLFNKLTGRRLAIVEDTPGVTRDRLYAQVEWLNRTFTVIDTGGIVLDDRDPLTVQVRLQAQLAMDEADAIVFVCDAAEGVTAADLELADALRGSPVPVYIAANKADSTKVMQTAVEFYSLGYPEVFPISSIHGHGVGDLLDVIAGALQDSEADDDDDDAARIAVIGRPNVGKSSLTNAILGEDRVIVSPIPGTTRDAIDTRLVRDGREIVMVDTAGIRRAGKIQGSVEYYTVLRAKTAIERCDVAVVVVDANEGLADGDKRVAGMAHEAGRACVIAVNKWDLVNEAIVNGRNPDRAKVLEFTEKLRDEMPFVQYAPIVFCSALHRFSVSQVVDVALECVDMHAMRVPTGELNRIIRHAVEDHPRLEHGKQLKVYYATMPRVKPPTVLMFVNDPDMVHFSYLRYLENRIRAAYRYEGTPLILRARRAESRQDAVRNSGGKDTGDDR
jgi:GTP-binding protein